MPERDLIVVGASAGGVEALRTLVSGLPRGLPASVFVVLHMPPGSVSLLPTILDRAGPLRAAAARDGEPIEPGRIYVAIPDRHLIVDRGRVRVTRGPRESGHRPAVDVLFRSAAMTYGPRVVGVVLSGTLDDGTAGLATVKRMRGVAIVQSPDDALFPSMPRNAAEQVDVDHTVAVDEMPALLGALAKGQESEVRTVEETPSKPSEPGDPRTAEEIESIPSVFACPDCGGVLWELHEGDVLRFRCRVGHAYTSDGLLAKQSEALEDALWAAVRGLEENAALSGRLSRRAREHGHEVLVRRFEERRHDADRRAQLIREQLLNGDEALELQTAGEDSTQRVMGASE